MHYMALQQTARAAVFSTNQDGIKFIVLFNLNSVEALATAEFDVGAMKTAILPDNEG